MASSTNRRAGELQIESRRMGFWAVALWNKE
jgi:hypothetical protein